jgi:hypothetical protein
MLQVALSLYLSLAVVIGPALCCCTMDGLFSGAVSSSACSHAGCCKSRNEPVGHGRHSHSHIGHPHSAGSHSEASQQSSNEPAPCDHGQKKCPCKQHRETMAASQASQDLGQWSLDSVSDFFSTFSFAVLPFASLEKDAASTLKLGEFRPRGVYGREILRAYHKLQC